jgi:3-oxoacyl-[acyl-carrier protein] reductase
MTEKNARSEDLKLLVITGVTGGLGSHMAARALESGYAVTGLARNPPPEDPGYPVSRVDVTDPGAVAAFFRSLRGKPLWGVINAAGVSSMNLLLTTPPETLARLVNVNLLGAMYCCAEGARLLMRRGGGRIINFSTIATPLALAGESAYAAAKAGVETLTRCLAREMGGLGITVNAVAPGPVKTAMIRGLTDEQIDAVVQRQLIRRLVAPEDVWAAVEFLLEEKSAMLTGEVLHIGGV